MTNLPDRRGGLKEPKMPATPMIPELPSPTCTTYTWSKRFVAILGSGGLFGFLAHVAGLDAADGFAYVVDIVTVSTILAALIVLGILHSVISKDETLSEAERSRFSRSIRWSGPVGALEVFLVTRRRSRSSQTRN